MTPESGEEGDAPAVSIGLPVYNGERFLAQAIESILGQDFTDFELIIADNGSTDETAEICAKYAAADDRVDVHRSAENRGAAWNFNRCVDHARGRYFKWAADDDVLEPGYLTKCLEALAQDPDVVLCYPRAIDIDEVGRWRADHSPVRYGTQDRPHQRFRSVLLQQTPCLEAFGVMPRARLLQTSRIGGYTASDMILFAELAMLGRFHEVPETLFLHREHAGRSLVRYADGRDRNIWFDPRRAGTHTLPNWRLLREYSRVALTARIRFVEHVRCIRPLLVWVGRHRSALARELASGILHVLGLPGHVRRIRMLLGRTRTDA